MDRKIRLVFLEGLTVDDVLKLKAGGFFEGAPAPIPTGVVGKEVALKVKEEAEAATVVAAPVVVPEPAPVSLPSPKPEPEPVAEAQPQPTNNADLDVAKLASYSKLRDLLQYLLDSGIPAEGAVAFCEQMKEEVPLLKRINIPERVARTLEVMGASTQAG